MLRLEGIREEVTLESGREAEVINLKAAEMSEDERRAGQVVFDKAAIIRDSESSNKKITLISVTEGEEDNIKISYYSSRFGTLYPDPNYMLPRYQTEHFKIIDNVRLKYAIARKNERDAMSEESISEEPMPEESIPVESKNEEVIELSYDEAKDMVLELNGVGEKTADNVIEAIAKGETLEEVPYLPDQAKEQIEELLHDGVALV